MPPVKTALTGGRGCRARDRAVRRIREVGRRSWKKEPGYNQQARAESTFFRYKRGLGDRLHVRAGDAQIVEVLLACNILTCLAEIGMLASYAIRRIEAFAAVSSLVGFMHQRPAYAVFREER